MKMSQTRLLNDLLSEVTRLLAVRFTPRPIDIKQVRCSCGSLVHARQAIEKLIEREYLARDTTDRKKILYLA